MFNKENEYKKAFNFQKRWVKHWTTPSAHRAHSSTDAMKPQAEDALKKIIEINNLNLSFEEKIINLLDYYKNCQLEQSLKPIMGTPFYRNNIQYIETQIKNIENNIPVEIYKMPKY